MEMPFIDFDGDGVNDFSAIITFGLATCLSSFAGLAALLRSDKPTSFKNVCSSMVNAGILGLAIALIWFFKFKDNIYFLIGICIVAGLSGLGAIESILSFIRDKIKAILGGEKNG